jgi:hypothetical protein
MVEHNIGAQDDEAFVLNKIDEDFFEVSEPDGLPSAELSETRYGKNVMCRLRSVD